MAARLKHPKVGEEFNPRDDYPGMDGTRIPYGLAAFPGVSWTAKGLYGHWRHRGGPTGNCFPSIQDAANGIGLTGNKAARHKAVQRAAKELVDAKLVRLEMRTRENGQRTTNRVIFLWHPCFEISDVALDKFVPYPQDAAVQTVLDKPVQRYRTRVSRQEEATIKPHHQTSTNETSNQERCSLSASPARAFPETEPRVSNSDFSDDDDSLRGPWASADEELKAIFRHKAGEQIPIFLLDQIRADLVSNGVEMADFVAEIRKHLKGNWLNPPAFIRSRSKGFRKLTRTVAPMTAAEAEAKRIAAEEAGYRCALCGSRKRGEGLMMAEGNMIACACASPEYVAHQIERGVLKAAGAAA
ncbi:hypothetical protein F183_A29780 [Bryobacterales bacterium F-183]|nr:hypothetical protein F183_A29780 [Bryobacterales bacterium F-183]